MLGGENEGHTDTCTIHIRPIHPSIPTPHPFFTLSARFRAALRGVSPCAPSPSPPTTTASDAGGFTSPPSSSVPTAAAGAAAVVVLLRAVAWRALRRARRMRRAACCVFVCVCVCGWVMSGAASPKHETWHSLHRWVGVMMKGNYLFRQHRPTSKVSIDPHKQHKQTNIKYTENAPCPVRRYSRCSESRSRSRGSRGGSRRGRRG